MPSYDFKCKDCKTTFSIFASFSSIIGCRTSCPCCKSENIERVYSPPNVIYKGKGFYTTDNEKEEDS